MLARAVTFAHCATTLVPSSSAWVFPSSTVSIHPSHGGRQTARRRPHHRLQQRLIPHSSTTTHASRSNDPSTAETGTGTTTTTDVTALHSQEKDTPLYDALVIGAGPAGLSLAAALAARSLSVCCVDSTFSRPWPNHYGVWRDEFESVGLEQCATACYDTTVIHTSNVPAGKITLDRSYIRVDRVMLKANLVEQCKRNGVLFFERSVSNVEHVSAKWSRVTLDYNKTSDSIGEGEALRSRLVIDCTGHAVAFTAMDKERSSGLRTWYQAAYGIEAEVKSYPYPKDEMVLMDFRDKHMTTVEHLRASQQQPTFLYVFPGGEKRAFFEETSVIQSVAVSFEELKARLHRRLEHDGVEIERVIEEELSFIPLGGLLPDLSQRVVAFGGAALLVHPATGYMVGRTMKLAQRLADQMKESFDRIGEDGDVSDVAKDSWDQLWGVRVRRQRDFLVFGAELLESLDMTESADFFDAFFKLPRELWVKFLAYELDSPLVRAQFAFMFFVVANNSIRIRLLRAMVEIGRWKMMRSILPEWMTANQD